MIQEKLRSMETDIRMWWRLSSELHHLASTAPESLTFKLALEEAEALLMYTAWPKLRLTIQTRIADYATQRGGVCAFSA